MEILTKIGIAHKNQRFFFDVFDAMFAWFDVIFLENKCAMRLPSQKKGICYVTLI